MNPIKVLAVGVSSLEIEHDENIFWMIYSPSFGDPTTGQENYLAMKKAVESADVVVINLDSNYLLFDHGVILSLAYSTSTPIFRVGTDFLRPTDFFPAFVSSSFDTLDEVEDHLRAYYC